MAFCPLISGLFNAGVLIYAFFSGVCAAAFWAIVVQAVRPRLPITKITLLSLLLGLALHYMRNIDGWLCDNFSFQVMLIAESLLSFICIGIALFLRRRLRIDGIGTAR
jgi:hypothetical protein